VLAPHFDVAVGADDQDAALAQLAHEKLQQQQGRLVSPVQVVEDEHEGPPHRTARRNVAMLSKSRKRGLVRLEDRRRRHLPEALAHLGHKLATSAAPAPSASRNVSGSASRA